MSIATALDFTYLYPFESDVGESEEGFGLRLATCGAEHEHPYFFSGRLRYPRCVGDLLLVLANVVRTHFFLPRPPNLDPVVTSSEAVLRFEGFSGCCGAYVRVDLPAGAFDSDIHGRGTTNVDFNNPMRAALTRLRDRDDARLAVGTDEVALSRGEHKVVEKKVRMPMRWIKSFSEVQAYQSMLTLEYELPAAETRRFIRSLPRGGAPKQPSFVTQVGKTIRLSQRERPGAVRVSGLDRLRVLEPLLSSATDMRIWADAESGVSAWEMNTPGGRLFLLVSPDLYRGFSGEGQILSKLAAGCSGEAVEKVRKSLAWQAEIDAGAIARSTKLDEGAVEAALAVLGSRGLAGFDVTTGRYFHRELPFELEKVEQMQPRLKGARKLLERGGLEVADRPGEEAVDLRVPGTGVMHYVRLRPDGDKCTCPWFSKHQGQRGPCKHILASRMFVEGDDSESDA